MISLADISVTLDDIPHINIAVGDAPSLSVQLQSAVYIDYEHYSGSYEVVPHTTNDIILNTDNKVMDNNVTVKQIPYAETSNVYGKTVTIGG